jgi:hypothetical protein
MTHQIANYNVDDIFSYHIWKKLKIGDILTIERKRKKLVIKARVMEVCGAEKYKLQVVEKIGYYTDNGIRVITISPEEEINNEK